MFGLAVLLDIKTYVIRIFWFIITFINTYKVKNMLYPAYMFQPILALVIAKSDQPISYYKYPPDLKDNIGKRKTGTSMSGNKIHIPISTKC